MPLKIKLKVTSDDEQASAPQVATSAKKGKRSRQIINDDGSESDHAPPAKRRTSAAARDTQSRHKASGDSEREDGEEVDVEGTDSDSPSRARQKHDDADSPHAPSPTPARPPKPDRHGRSKANRIESEDEPSEDDRPARSRSTETSRPPRPPARQNAARDVTPTGPGTKPLRKPVVAKTSKDKDQPGSTLSSIPAIPRRSKDALAVKDTQDMDLLNKDVYNQLFNTSSSSKPAKNVQNEAKQKEINAKRQAAKAALLKARESTFDLQFPTDKVLAFESRLRKLHRWYSPSALGFTYHEELRQRQRQTR